MTWVPIRTCVAVAAIGSLVSACTDRAPGGYSAIAAQTTTIRFNPTAPLLSEVPWPNDSLCWTRSPPNQVCHPNVSVSGLDPVLERWVSAVNATSGWPNTTGISIPFQRSVGAPEGPAIDLARLLASQRDFDFSNDSVYLVDLTTGIPTPLDFDRHLSSFALQNPVALDPSDPHRRDLSLTVESEDERLDGETYKFDYQRTSDGTVSGQTLYKPQWDRDSDGILDVPNYERGRSCTRHPSASGEADVEYDRCVADSVIDSYDPASDTLELRPRVPLKEHTQYAVLVTSRLLDRQLLPIASPFATKFHPMQQRAADEVSTILAKPELASYFGSLATTGLAEVSFLWTFTTASPVASLARNADELTQSAASSRITFDEEWALDEHCSGGSRRDWLIRFISERSSLDAGEVAALRESLGSIVALRTGTFEHRHLETHDDPSSTPAFRPTESLDAVPFLLTIPESAADSRTIELALYAHDVRSSRLEPLAFAGHFAGAGVALAAADRLGAETHLTNASRSRLEKLAKTHCSAGLMAALLKTRSVTQEPVASPLGLDVVATANRWRASALEMAELASGWVGTELPQGEANRRAGFRWLGYVGQGEGGSIATMAAALAPKPPALAVVDAPTSPHRAWARSNDWGQNDSPLYRLFGPRLAGVSVDSPALDASACERSESSLRVLSVEHPYPGVEIGCLPVGKPSARAYPSGILVVATNSRTLARRCVATTTEGEFSMGLAAHAGDDFELAFYGDVSLVTRLGENDSCELTDPTARPILSLVTSAAKYRTELPHGFPQGLGLERQSNAFRQVVRWAGAAFQGANVAAYARALGNRSAGRGAIGTLFSVSPGNARVSPDEGLRLATALDLVPNLPPDALATYPSLAGTITPTLLSTSLRSPTAELAVASSHLAEGVARLRRHDPQPAKCGVNASTDADSRAWCNAPCTNDGDCSPGSICGLRSRCEPKLPDEAACAEFLYDADRLADGSSGTNNEAALVPYRLARYAGNATLAQLAELWQPRTISRAGLSVIQPLHPDWPFAALMLPLSEPRGSHGFPRDTQCQQFRYGKYVPRVLAQFLASGGRYYAPVLDWDKQSCLGLSQSSPQCTGDAPPE